MPRPHPDAIAECVLHAFNALPLKFKPRRLADGRGEWVPLAGIVLSGGREGSQSPASSQDGTNSNPAENIDKNGLICASLATGMKCLPQSKVNLAKGNILHDGHAEVLAIRAFNRFLVDECAELARRGFGSTSGWIKWRQRGQVEQQRADLGHGVAGGKQPFELKHGVGIHMYCSECPCGDASMENVMASQQDSTPWSDTLPASDLLGRGHFDQLGVVRRKPARADAPLTLSKSCSDKLALKQVTSLLSSIVGKLIWPGNVYLSTLVLPESQIVPAAVERAWGTTGRMNPVTALDPNRTTEWEMAGYSFRPFSVKGTMRTFEYGKSTTQDNAAVPSNIAAVSTPHAREVLINGVLQGRQQLDPRGSSSVSRRKMWQAVADVAELVDEAALRFDTKEDMVGIPVSPDGGALAADVGEGSYAEAKSRCVAREDVKRVVKQIALKGWTKNEGDDGWCLNDSAE